MQELKRDTTFEYPRKNLLKDNRTKIKSPPGHDTKEHSKGNPRPITETPLRINTGIHLCFIDLKKAFDKIRRADLRKDQKTICYEIQNLEKICKQKQ